VRVAASTLVTSLALLVAAGIVLSARVWTTLTVLKLLPLVALAGAFLLSGQVTALPPLAPAAEVSWLRAALLATFAYQGFEIVPVIAGHVRSPSSAVPIATLGSVGFAALLYVILQSACVVVLPHLASSAAPLAEAAGVLGGPALARAVAVGTSVSALGICFGMMVTTPRYLSALAHGRSHVLALDRETAQGVPLRALGVTWVVVMVLLQVGSRAELFALSAIAVVTQFVVTAAALAALAHRRERGLRRWHLAVALPAMAVGLGLVSGATAREAAAAAGAVLLGLVLRRVGRMEQARPAPAEGVG
jgi:amino acid transporter